jgi:hypothetical protein
MSDEKKVTTTSVFIGDAMTVKHLGRKIENDRLEIRKLTTEHLRVALEEQNAGKKPPPTEAQDKKEQK